MKFRKTFVMPHKVLFEEVDLGAAVHHPNYLKFMERGRCQAMDESGVSFGKCMAQGFALVVSEMNVKYLRPLRLEDEIYVVSRIVAIRKSSTKVMQVIARHAPTPEQVQQAGDNLAGLPGVVFSAQVRLVCVQLSDGRPHEFPDFLKQCMSIPLDAEFADKPEWRDVRIGHVADSCKAEQQN